MAIRDDFWNVGLVVNDMSLTPRPGELSAELALSANYGRSGYQTNRLLGDTRCQLMLTRKREMARR